MANIAIKPTKVHARYAVKDRRTILHLQDDEEKLYINLYIDTIEVAQMIPKLLRALPRDIQIQVLAVIFDEYQDHALYKNTHTVRKNPALSR